MTVNTTSITSGPYTGNNVTTSFSYGFKVQTKNDLEVYETNLSGDRYTLVVDQDYTVNNIGEDSGGTITRVAGALPTGWTWYIRAAYNQTQDTEFTSQGAFFPELHEDAMDKMTFLIQQLQDGLDRSLRFESSYNSGGAILPPPEAYKLMRWRADLLGLENIDISTIDPDAVVINDYIKRIESIAALMNFEGTTTGQTVEVVSYYDGWAGTVEGPIGGGTMVWNAGSTETPNPVTIFKVTGVDVGRWERVINKESISIFDAGGRRGEDIKAALQACVDASPSTHDITAAYIYEPSWKIRIPYGNYFLSERVLITKNNIIIEGDGMFNTNIMSTSNAPGDPVQSEMIRFRGAYACGIKNLTLDGGLPFNVLSTPNHGCRIPLVLDQVAHFDMDGFNSCNYRTRGIQGIHVWESKFGEIRCFNGWGLNDALGIAPGGLVFDEFSKEENFFPGAESNQVYIAKYAFSGVGSAVRFGAPCFNIVIGQGVFEGRTYNTYQPNNMDISKIYISGLSANCGIQHAWVYFHDQPFNAPSVLIEAFNAGPGCYFDNINLYQENAAPGVNHMELQQLLNSSSAFPVRVNLNIQDIDNETDLFQGVASGSLFQGDVFYRNDDARTLDDFVGGTGATNFNGQVTMSTGAFGVSVPQVYNFKSVGQDVSAIDGAGIYSEYKCRAWVKFNGSTGAIIGTARNVASVTKNSTGNYSVVFSEAMPDANYAATATSNASATGAERAYVAGYNASNFNVVNGVGAGFADATVITCAVFR